MLSTAFSPAVRSTSPLRDLASSRPSPRRTRPLLRAPDSTEDHSSTDPQPVDNLVGTAGGRISCGERRSHPQSRPHPEPPGPHTVHLTPLRDSTCRPDRRSAKKMLRTRVCTGCAEAVHGAERLVTVVPRPQPITLGAPTIHTLSTPAIPRQERLGRRCPRSPQRLRQR